MSQIYVMTIPQKEMTKRELLHYLRFRSGRWQFGIEKGGNTGYRHYQVRYETSNGDLGTERLYWTGIACELELSNGWSTYELKDGHFYTSDDDDMGKYRFRPLRGFQTRLHRYLAARDDRAIGIVIDNVGGKGKTHWARWEELNGNAVYIDGNGTDENVTRDVFDISEDKRIKAIIIDCTRSDRLDDKRFWAGLERLKNGHLCDRRYGYRSKWIAPPTIVVLANTNPDWRVLSADRWHKFFIGQETMSEYVNGEKVGTYPLS